MSKKRLLPETIYRPWRGRRCSETFVSVKWDWEYVTRIIPGHRHTTMRYTLCLSREKRLTKNWKGFVHFYSSDNSPFLILTQTDTLFLGARHVSCSPLCSIEIRRSSPIPKCLTRKDFARKTASGDIHSPMFRFRRGHAIASVRSYGQRNLKLLTTCLEIGNLLWDGGWLICIVAIDSQY